MTDNQISTAMMEAIKKEIADSLRSALTWAQQPDAVLDQDNPASGVKYTILNTTTNVRIENIIVRCTWTVQPNLLEIYTTIDGISKAYIVVNPLSDNDYYPREDDRAVIDVPILQLTADFINRAYIKEGRSVKIEAEITGGTVSNMSGRVKFAQRDAP